VRLLGEKSPPYCVVPKAAQRIAHHHPEVKLLWALRNPVDRTYSNYLHAVKRGAEPKSFEAALERERRGRADLFRRYLSRSRYSEQIERFLQFFPVEHMHFVLFEDLVAGGDASRSALRFLGVDAEGYVPPAEPRNPTVLPRSKVALHWARRALGTGSRGFRWANRALTRGMAPGYPRMSSETRALLLDEFASERQRLTALLGLELSGWAR